MPHWKLLKKPTDMSIPPILLDHVPPKNKIRDYQQRDNLKS